MNGSILDLSADKFTLYSISRMVIVPSQGLKGGMIGEE